MTNVQWSIKAREFANCNCAYGCPCQFNAMPTHGNCMAVIGMDIDEGHYGAIPLDGLKVAGVFTWPGAIHQGQGQATVVIDRRANTEQREALLRIVSGQDTDPGATVFQVFSTTFETLHDPVFADIEFKVDVEQRRAQLKVADLIDAHGEPLINPVSQQPHRARIDLPNGFEFSIAEIGRGWAEAQGATPFTLSDSHAHFANLHLTQSGVVR